MSFASVSFAAFLAVVFALYWVLPCAKRWVALLTASVFFAACFDVKLVFVLVYVTLAAYAMARLIERAKTQKARRALFITGVVACVSALVVFKYLGFFIESANAVLRAFSLPASSFTLKLLLPVGISFYTFQAVSYLTDVYKGKIAAERHMGYFALYMAFFPKLSSGPIERASDLLPQLRKAQAFDETLAVSGLKQMAWGFFKKIALADCLIRGVDAVYANPGAYSAPALLLATLAFSVQVYCDFSGYSDIAVGCGKLFGFSLSRNFNSPYFAQNIKEFWSRWHITLSRWFRDYVYIPLGGNRRGTFRRTFNVLITFALSGLWHGANVTFLLWGAYHGVLNALSNAFGRKKSERRNYLCVLLTFIAVTAGWVMFRANTVADALTVFQAFVTPEKYVFSMSALKDTVKIFCSSDASVISLAFSLILLTLFDFFSLKTDVLAQTGRLPRVLRWAIYVLFVLFVLLCPGQTQSASFIYAQF